MGCQASLGKVEWWSFPARAWNEAALYLLPKVTESFWVLACIAIFNYKFDAVRRRALPPTSAALIAS